MQFSGALFLWLVDGYQLCSIIITVATFSLVRCNGLVYVLTVFFFDFGTVRLFLWLILVDCGGKTQCVVGTIKGLFALFEGWIQ